MHKSLLPRIGKTIPAIKVASVGKKYISKNRMRHMLPAQSTVLRAYDFIFCNHNLRIGYSAAVASVEFSLVIKTIIARVYFLKKSMQAACFLNPDLVIPSCNARVQDIVTFRTDRLYSPEQLRRRLIHLKDVMEMQK